MKKNFTRIMSFLTALLTVCGSLTVPADAREVVTWEVYGEEDGFFWCDDCDDLLPLDEANECGDPDCDDLFCDNCICSSCGRCYVNDHCICDFNPDDYLQMDDELDIPDKPDYNFTPAEDLVSRDYSVYAPGEQCIAVSETIDNNSARLLSQFCALPSNSQASLASCVESLRQTSDVLKLIRTVDTTDPDTFHQNDFMDPINRTANFIEKMTQDPAIRDFLANNFKFESDNGIYTQVWVLQKDGAWALDVAKLTKLSNQYLDLLKKMAVSAGFRQSELDKIKLTFANSNQLDANNSAGEWDETANLVNLNAYYVSDGRDFAETLTHEFTHALETLERKEAGDEPDTLRQIRLIAGRAHYHSDAENRYIGYMTNIDEAIARKAEYKVYGEDDIRQDWAYLVKHYGTEILPLLAEANNARHGYSGESLKILNMLAEKAPELELLVTDIDFTALELVEKKDLMNALGSNVSCLVRCRAANGTEYILPTQRLLRLTERALGTPLTGFYEKLLDMVDTPDPSLDLKNNEGYPAVMTDLMYDPDFGTVKGPETHVADPVPCTEQAMTADDFLFCLSVAASMILADSFEGNEAAVKEYSALMSKLMLEAESLQDQLDTAEKLGGLQDELESLEDDAEYLQEELQALLEEYASLEDAFDTLCEEKELELEDLRNQLMADGRNLEDDAYGMTASEIEGFLEDLNSAFQFGKSDMEEELETLVGDMEDLAGQIENIGEDLEAVFSDMQSKSDDMEALAAEVAASEEKMAELQDEMDKLAALMQKAGAGDILEIEIERRVKVTVTDKDGNPIAGAPVYLKEPGSKVGRFAGNTDEKGKLETAVDGTANSGLTLMIGNDDKFRALDGRLYQCASQSGLVYTVLIEDDTPVFVLEAEFEAALGTELSWYKPSNILRVTIRAYEAAEAEVVKDWNNDDITDPKRYKNVGWLEYYKIQIETPKIMRDGHTRHTFWYEKMDEAHADYYGAYLLPLSADGELPRTEADIIFEPLYTWENGRAKLNLKVSKDFSTVRSGCKYPCESYAFDFGYVPIGRYELAIILPDTKYACHFQEIEVKPDLWNKPNTVLAQTWTDNDNMSSDAAYREKHSGGCGRQYTELSFDPDIYSLSGKKLYDTVTPVNGEAVFALAVDAAGNKLWSVVRFEENGRLKLPARNGWEESGWWSGHEGVSHEECVGQVYLYAKTIPGIRLLPITYLNDYDITYSDAGRECGRHYLYSQEGRIYGLDRTRKAAAQADPLAIYVAFWEEYYDEDLNVHYRTYDKPVSFSLFWETGDTVGNYSVVEERLHLVDAVSTNKLGRMTNYLYQKKLTEKGASYTFSYYYQDRDIFRGQKTLKQIPVTMDAERIVLEEKDGLDWLFLPQDLTGEALMTVTEKDENGKTVKYTKTVTPTRLKTPDGVVLRFIVGTSCSSAGHLWKLEQTEATCTEDGPGLYRCVRCGEVKQETVSYAGHLHDESEPDKYIDPQSHGFVCERCGETIITGSHRWGESTVLSQTCTKRTSQKTCQDCGKTKTVASYGSWHEYEARAKTWFDSEYHWQYCKKCGEAYEEKHDLYSEKGLLYCSSCNFTKQDPADPNAYQWKAYVWADRSVCCPHVAISASYVLVTDFRSLDYYYTRETRWEFSYDENVTVIGTGDTLNLWTVSQNLFAVNADGGHGAIRPVMVWGERSLAGQWVEVLPLTYVEGTAATCETEGVQDHWRCSCGAYCDAYGNRIDITLPELPHVYGNACDDTCDRCGAPRETTHDFGTEWTSGEGYHWRSCEICGAPDTKHACTPGDWIVDVLPGCETAGKKHRDCKVCGERLAEEEIPPEHSFVTVTTEETPAAAPGTDGGEGKATSGLFPTEEQHCENCGLTETVTGALPIEHHWDQVDAVPADCTKEGMMTYYRCEDCGGLSLDRKGKVKLLSLKGLELEIDPEAHAYDAAGKCVYCGQMKPLPSEETAAESSVPETAEAESSTAWETQAESGKEKGREASQILLPALSAAVTALILGTLFFLREKRREEE